ncbi:nucleoside diphosphate kinase 6-like [Diadema antillarum]|uniref:nucleoside diphosphate kinase 6-like n=1 Tax=Diadema antillarum TaxID=105358 RepID=UPI003A8ACF12
MSRDFQVMSLPESLHTCIWSFPTWLSSRTLLYAQFICFLQMQSTGRFFYNRLVGFMMCGPMCAQILAGDNVITRWRELMGPTKTFRAKHIQPDTIRGQHGLTDTRNATHGSDSPETASREIGFFFPEFSIQRWYEREEPLYRDESVPVMYCKELHLHIPRPADILLES